MGMFDYIRCDAELPETPLPPPRGAMFQTKDTPDQGLDKYVITKDGTLVRTAIGSEGDVTFKDYNGNIAFYTSGPDHVGWWEYEARFVDGWLQEITLVQFDDPRDADATL